MLCVQYVDNVNDKRCVYGFRYICNDDDNNEYNECHQFLQYFILYQL